MKHVIKKLIVLDLLTEQDKTDPDSVYTYIMKSVQPKYREIAKLYMRIAYTLDYSLHDIIDMHRKYLYAKQKRIYLNVQGYGKNLPQFKKDLDKVYYYNTVEKNGIVLNEYEPFKKMLKNSKFLCIVCLVEDPYTPDEKTFICAYNTLQKYGSRSWCISKCESTFRNYTDDKRAIQYVLISKNAVNAHNDELDTIGNRRLGANARFGITMRVNETYESRKWPFRFLQKNRSIICFDDNNNQVSKIHRLLRLTKQFPIDQLHTEIVNNLNIRFDPQHYRGRTWNIY